MKHAFYKKSLQLLIKDIPVILSFTVIIVFSLSAIFAPFITKYDPDKQILSQRLLEPGKEHWFGTD